MAPVKLISRIVLTLVLAAPATALADGSAAGFVKQRQSQLTSILKRGKTAGNDKKIAAIFDGMLDYETLARASLHDHWDKRSGEERSEFQSVLKQLVQRAYRRNLDKTINYAIDFRGEAKGDRGYVVRTVAKSTRNAREEPIEIDYVVKKVDGAWRVQDIVTEGSSLVNNYRRQFARIIKKKGFDELMRRMKKKLASG